jgi:excisionase family DNA binding protein
MQEREYLTRPEAAEILRTPIQTLAQWASQGRGPRYARVGRKVLYERSEIERFIAENMVGPGGSSGP